MNEGLNTTSVSPVEIHLLENNVDYSRLQLAQMLKANSTRNSKCLLKS